MVTIAAICIPVWKLQDLLKHPRETNVRVLTQNIFIKVLDT